ncbi:hypothetical protein AC579_2782 [Pseudocercospora musae]|uniref:Uncharacterized protein n=1 Tax=Pseudocercospora musae TaxID=113226 RepID=A0A139H1N4_9PEZI|nr:hypothetical protein AC579_2782 [Pseudocercospora musae]
MPRLRNALREEVATPHSSVTTTHSHIMADTNATNGVSADVEMKEEVPAEVHTSLSNIQQAHPQASVNPSTHAQPEHLSSIAPAVATPPAGSSANRPGSMPPQPTARPEKPVAHGGPTRQYLNSHVTPHLLEAMKYLAVYEPEKPLLWLSDFLRDRSKEIEG